jgi:hypothetical protein
LLLSIDKFIFFYNIEYYHILGVNMPKVCVFSAVNIGMDYIPCKLCPSCNHFEIKESNIPYYCHGGSNRVAACESKQNGYIEMSGCKKYEPKTARSTVNHTKQKTPRERRKELGINSKKSEEGVGDIALGIAGELASSFFGGIFSSMKNYKNKK